MMQRSGFILVVLAWWIACPHAGADGKMYVRERVPALIPYQRALLMFREGTETLVLQSQYRVPQTATNVFLGWVVPVPGRPEVATVRNHMGSRIFRYLDFHSRPRVTRLGAIFWMTLFWGVFGLSILILLACLVSLVWPFPAWFTPRRERLARLAVAGLVGCVALALLLPALATAKAGVDHTGVEVLSDRQVGIYHVRVIRSENAGELMDWLNGNRFQFGQEDRAAFDGYLAKSWCFVVAQVNQPLDLKEVRTRSEGLVDPLILRFAHDAPVYPLALTATGGHPTEILLYLLSPEKMTCGNRLPLRFAGAKSGFGEMALDYLRDLVEPRGFFGSEDLAVPFFCKFRGVLTPEQMTQDLVFEAAPDQEPYREHVVKW